MKGWLTIGVLGVSVLLGACSVLFDAPPENAAKQKVSARAEHEVTSIAKEEARAIYSDATTHTAGTERHQDSQTLTSADGKRTLTLSFEKADTGMPQLVMRGLSDAIVRIDGERIEPTRQEHIVLISTGQHELSVEYANGQPFSAKFYLKKGERAVLRAGSVPAK